MKIKQVGKKLLKNFTIKDVEISIAQDCENCRFRTDCASEQSEYITCQTDEFIKKSLEVIHNLKAGIKMGGK